MPSPSAAITSRCEPRRRSRTDMNKIDTAPKLIGEAMRIGGKKVEADDAVPVHYPYSHEVIGTVPAGRDEHAAQHVASAARRKPKLKPYEHQQILVRTAERLQPHED